eukprot:COSAG01_NODE_1131_length_11572_cov_84.273337_9_plen_80_part_00
MKYMRGHGDQTTNMTRESGDLADTVAGNSRSNPFLFFIFWNAVLALLACLPTVFIAPEAAGSGIPEVMGYLNGAQNGGD